MGLLHKGREGRGGEGPTYKGEVKGGEGREKGGSPRLYGPPGSRGATIVTECNKNDIQT